MIDPLRHISVFDPNAFNHRIDIIGVGATGSRIAMSLAKLGITNIHIWDPDVIESHNIPNQVFFADQIGQHKVDALHDLILQSTGISVTIHSELVEEPKRFGDIVFLLVDSMATRRSIWEQSIKLQLNVKLMIETRMGPESGRVYAVNPIKSSNIDGWESTLYSDEVSTDNVCGATISVGPTAEVITGVAVWLLIRWFRAQTTASELDIGSESIISLDPLFVSNRSF